MEKNIAIVNESKVALKDYLRGRKDILKFVGKQLIEGTDYGATFFDNNGQPKGKPSLKKPGAEKICMYAQADPIFVPDIETREMLGLKGVVNYICFLIPRDKKPEILKQLKSLGKENEIAIYRSLSIAEGRGGYTIKQTYKGEEKINTVIKMAEKSALVDTVLRVAGLSELFTQDKGETNGAGKQPPRNVTPQKRTEPKAVGTVSASEVDRLLASMKWLPDNIKAMYIKQALSFKAKGNSGSLAGLIQSLTKQIALKKKESGREKNE